METRVGDNEPLEQALKRFRRQCQQNGVLQEIKKREHYEKPSERRKNKRKLNKKKR